MKQKQISLTLPETLFEASVEYSEEYGYRTVQEFIVDLVRHKVLLENVERYRQIEARMQKGVGVKRFGQKQAAAYVRGL